MSAKQIHFIVSAPRSGSTWLAQALNRHPQIFATAHRQFGDFCEMWPNNNGTHSPRMTFDAYAKTMGTHYFHPETSDSRLGFIDDFISAYVEFLIEFAQKKSGKSIVFDKVTPYPGTCELVIQKIRQYFPAAKIVRLIRDGRDVATSGAFDWLLKDGKGTPRHDHFVAQQSDSRLDRFFDDAVLKKWAGHWAEVCDAVPAEAYDVAVKYEDMLQDQATELMKILESVGADADADLQLARECATAVTFVEQAGREPGLLEPTAKMRNGTAGDWKNYFTRHDAELFEGIAGEQLRSTGYESDKAWPDKRNDKLELEVALNRERAE